MLFCKGDNMSDTSKREYLFREGYELMKFKAEFTENYSLCTDSKDRFPLSVNCQFLHCIANDVEKARVLIDRHYKSQGIECKEIVLIKPRTTTNSDLRFLSNPENIIGFNDGIISNTKC